MSGTETELDRTVIDEIGDPLIILLEILPTMELSPLEIRKEIGKPPSGYILI